LEWVSENFGHEHSTASSSPKISCFTASVPTPTSVTFSQTTNDWKAKLAALDADEPELDDWAAESERLEEMDQKALLSPNQNGEWNYSDWKAKLEATFADEPEDWSDDYDCSTSCSASHTTTSNTNPTTFQSRSCIAEDEDEDEGEDEGEDTDTEERNEQLSPVSDAALFKFMTGSVDDDQPIPTLPVDLPIRPKLFRSRPFESETPEGSGEHGKDTPDWHEDAEDAEDAEDDGEDGSMPMAEYKILPSYARGESQVHPTEKATSHFWLWFGRFHSQYFLLQQQDLGRYSRR
jgi:hypothetical protein